MRDVSGEDGGKSSGGDGYGPGAGGGGVGGDGERLGGVRDREGKTEEDVSGCGRRETGDEKGVLSGGKRVREHEDGNEDVNEREVGEGRRVRRKSGIWEEKDDGRCRPSRGRGGGEGDVI